MNKFSVTHEFACTPETYWKLNFDREVNDALYKGAEAGTAGPRHRRSAQRVEGHQLSRGTAGDQPLCEQLARDRAEEDPRHRVAARHEDPG